MDFLVDLYDTGLGYSSINTARSALSSFGILMTGQSFGSHPLVIRLMKAVYNMRPNMPRYKDIWDVDIVLFYLRKLSPVKYLSLKELTLKLVMLLALITSARAQTLHLLDLECMKKLKDKFVFTMPKIIKQSRPGFENPDIIAKAYPVDRRICVYTVIKEYLQRTKFVRKDNYLLVSYIKPHVQVSASTISRWIKTVMQKSGIDIKKYKAHSVRAAATSKASNNNIPIQEIMKLAGWTQKSTFAKFYHKKVVRSTDAVSAILK